MTDLEMIASMIANMAKARERYPDDCVTVCQVRLESLSCLLTLAETGALLAEVERRWPHPRYDIHISRNDEPGPTWSVTIEDYAEEHGCGEGETFPAALRDLLGVDGG